MRLNLTKLNNKAALDGGRWELEATALGYIVINFYNRHGSLVDCLPASMFELK